jgi:hypothetical protein
MMVSGTLFLRRTYLHIPIHDDKRRRIAVWPVRMR